MVLIELFGFLSEQLVGGYLDILDEALGILLVLIRLALNG